MQDRNSGGRSAGVRQCDFVFYDFFSADHHVKKADQADFYDLHVKQHVLSQEVCLLGSKFYQLFLGDRNSSKSHFSR
jgi:hypothetical protein